MLKTSNGSDIPQTSSKALLTSFTLHLWAQILLGSYAKSTGRPESPIQLHVPKALSHLSFVNVNQQYFASETPCYMTFYGVYAQEKAVH